MPSAIFEASEWRDTFETAWEVAYHQWRRKHGNHGQFIGAVVNSTATLDLGYAEPIAEVFFEVFGQTPPLLLEGASAGPYLTQLLLSRFLGREPGITTAVTGVIGPPLDTDFDRRYPDRAIQSANKVGIKLMYARSADAYRSIALPATDGVKVKALLEAHVGNAGGTTQWDEFLNRTGFAYVDTMSSLSDVMQLGRWRQFRYVNTPEVRWRLHEWKGQYRDVGPYARRVDRMVAQVRANRRSVLHVSEDAEVVGEALLHLNELARTELKPSPPSLSWSFLRLGVGPDDQMWQTLWMVCGADERELHRVLHSSTADEAADGAEWLLNQLDPNESNPSHRAPDVIVLVRNDTYKPYLGNEISILDALQRLVERAPNALISPLGWTELLGLTRVIVVTEPHRGRRGTVAKVDDTGQQLLEELAVFRSGVSRQAALTFLQMRLKVTRSGARERLDAAIRSNLVRVSGDHCHVPRRHRPVLDESDIETARELVARHLAAGLSLAPYLAPETNISADIERVFDADVLLEAYHHYYESSRLAQSVHAKTGDLEVQRLRGVARSRSGRLTRLTSPDSWGAVRRMLFGTLTHDAYEMAKEIVRSRVSAGKALTPGQWLLAGRVAEACSHATRSVDSAASTELHHESKAHAHEWLGNSIRTAQESGGTWIEIAARSYLATVLDRDDPEQQSEALRLSAKTFELLAQKFKSGETEPASPVSISGDWALWYASLEEDHERSLERYHILSATLFRRANLVQSGMGAAALCDSNTQVARFRRLLPSDDLVNTVVASIAHSRGMRAAPYHLSQRWAIGLSLLANEVKLPHIKVPRVIRIDRPPYVAYLARKQKPRAVSPPWTHPLSEYPSLASVATRLRKVVSVPLWTPEAYRRLFEEIAQQWHLARQEPHDFDRTARGRLTAAGLRVTRKEIGFVRYRAVFPKLREATGPTPRELAQFLLDAILHHARTLGTIELSRKDEAVMAEWFGATGGPFTSTAHMTAIGGENA